ncbi:hypothetical protein RchiOBHm_Chr3g0487281 [Rosa chinensis]|uniref:Uncharacterized protein n=1 Tax=Rosa chinensis TaxID=74649 RepID=A0A2P6RFG2_ROSCH|nr:hypothetical protein RchiOBHm_Chr3g0487281 [Rosa chinensis]
MSKGSRSVTFELGVETCLRSGLVWGNRRNLAWVLGLFYLGSLFLSFHWLLHQIVRLLSNLSIPIE